MIPPKTPPTALTIAGSDSSGGAGIQADLKTFAALGVYGATAITAVTAQNTRGVRAVHAIPPEIVASQIDAVLDDLDVGAIKIGMIFSAQIAHVVAVCLARWLRIPVILDPVMIATSGDRLIDDAAITELVSALLPRCLCVTPNLAEAAVLSGHAVATNETEMLEQARIILGRGARSVLIKGGHRDGDDCVDLLVSNQGSKRYAARRIDTRNLHGTGCTLSAAIAAGIANGLGLEQAVGAAKRYLTAAIDAARDRAVGHGAGPVHHFHAFEQLFERAARDEGVGR